MELFHCCCYSSSTNKQYSLLWLFKLVYSIVKTFKLFLVRFIILWTILLSQHTKLSSICRNLLNNCGNLRLGLVAILLWSLGWVGLSLKGLAVRLCPWVEFCIKGWAATPCPWVRQSLNGWSARICPWVGGQLPTASALGQARQVVLCWLYPMFFYIRFCNNTTNMILFFISPWLLYQLYFLISTYIFMRFCFFLCF